MRIRPNLFNFATSELTQDAFICWLVSWSHDDYKDEPLLNEVGKNFLVKCFEKHKMNFPKNITSLEVKRQVCKLDILITINGKYSVLIEDKVFTSEHTDQLKRYIIELKKDVIYGENILIPIYFKTGNQSDYKFVKKAEYEVFDRKEMLELLEGGIRQGVDNSIFKDYLSYLSGIDKSIEGYKVLEDKSKWDGESWVGFFTELQRWLDEAQWDYVPNPSGGFMGLWWNFKDISNGSELYIQLEEERLCFKVAVIDQDKRKDIRDLWSEKVIEAALKDNVLKVKRPNRFGNGAYMTVAILEDDYRVFNEDTNTLNLGETIKRLKEAEKLLNLLID